MTFTIPVDCDFVPRCVKLSSTGASTTLPILSHDEDGNVVCSVDEYTRITLEPVLEDESSEIKIVEIREKESDDDDSSDGTFFGPVIALSSLIFMVSIGAGAAYMLVKKEVNIVMVGAERGVSGRTKIDIENSMEAPDVQKPSEEDVVAE